MNLVCAVVAPQAVDGPQHDPCKGVVVRASCWSGIAAVHSIILVQEQRYELCARAALLRARVRSLCRGSSSILMLGRHHCGLRCNLHVGAVVRTSHWSGRANLMPGWHHCGWRHNPRAGTAVQTSCWGRHQCRPWHEPCAGGSIAASVAAAAPQVSH